MNRTMTFAAALTLLLALTRSAFGYGIVAAKVVDANGDKSDDFIVVQVARGCGAKWVGCTVVTEGREFDLPTQRIGAEPCWLKLPGDLPTGTHRAIIAIWSKLAEGCGCKYCRKYGYHLEGEVDRTDVQVSVQ